MLTIRKEQIKIFEEKSLESFEKEIVLHIKHFSPYHYNYLGDIRILQIVKSGIKKAESYGIVYKGPVQLIIELMFILGSHFDADPQYPWIQEILVPNTNIDQLECAEKLYSRIAQYFNEAIGSDNKYERNAIKKVNELKLNNLTDIKVNTSVESTEKIKQIYPEKCNYLGDQTLTNLFNLAVTNANKYDMIDKGGIFLFFLIMFFFGHKCYDDLLYPWISNTLNGSNVNAESSKIKTLFSDFMEYCQRL